MTIVTTKYNFNNIAIGDKLIQPDTINATLIAVASIDRNLIGSHFFENMLKAIRLEKGRNAHVVELDMENNEYINHDFLQNGYTKLLLFGIAPAKCGFNMHLKEFELFQTQKYLIAHYPSLENIEKNIDLKKILWGSLKSVYKIQ